MIAYDILAALVPESVSGADLPILILAPGKLPATSNNGERPGR
jgi:hypothetical protein